MSINSCFRRRLEKQHGKCAQAMLKSASEHFYHIHWSLRSQFSQKKSLLLTCQILGFLVNKLDSDDRYPVLNRDNLTIVGQMQLTQKQKLFLNFRLHFLNRDLTLNILKKKMALVDFVFRKLRTSKTWSDKCLKSLFSEDPWTSNMVNVPKHCWILYKSTFIILTDHCQGNWFGKGHSN